MMGNKPETICEEHKVKTTHEEQKAKGECRHYWIIETANGPTSEGVCKYCGAEKEFLNSLPEFQWGGGISAGWEGGISTLFELHGLPHVEPDGEENNN
ncbi:MAG: hypothetical protein ACE5JL_18050 [Dehalococcoidia bacterium]